MFEIKHTTETSTEATLSRVQNIMLEYDATDFMGEGSFARVFGSVTSGIVVKTGHMCSNNAYLSYLEQLAVNEQYNPFLPIVYCAEYIHCADNPDESRFVVVMEKLNRLIDDTDFVDDLRTALEANIGGGFGRRLEVEFIAQAAEIAAMISLIKRAFCVAAARADSFNQPVVDVFDQNNMLRGDQFVITDPIA